MLVGMEVARKNITWHHQRQGHMLSDLLLGNQCLTVLQLQQLKDITPPTLYAGGSWWSFLNLEDPNMHLGKVDDRITKLNLVPFIKPFGHQECKCMSFGVSSAPKAFERIIALILEGFQEAEIRMNAVFNLD
ncbi:hypothetical protein WISP_91333 [Willisornis vidua]|uniref:Uncharacterized protein n=1 Tax=Willisornis vidua TaxID=1566151 RepID=A0ABQ9D1L6_9PASS|nr:hypothetical protein WISP_91333 [Willisornis vidua]